MLDMIKLLMRKMKKVEYQTNKLKKERLQLEWKHIELFGEEAGKYFYYWIKRICYIIRKNDKPMSLEEIEEHLLAQEPDLINRWANISKGLLRYLKPAITYKDVATVNVEGKLLYLLPEWLKSKHL